MEYTVQKLAKLSGVTVRTLHYYDEIGLLKPAYHGANGYRHYGEEELLRLQQILFFRELGFALKKIQEILDRKDFDKLIALSSHKQVLEKNLKRTRHLIETIDKTINHLKGVNKMEENQMYHGFSKEVQAAYEKELIERFGEKIKKEIQESHRRTAHWQKKDWKKSQEEFEHLCKELILAMEENEEPGGQKVQKMIKTHFEWIKKFWTPTKESYSGHADLILESDLRLAYEKFHPQLAEFIAKGIKYFSEHSL